MPELVVYVGRFVDCMRDFIAQEPAITLPQVIQLFFYHRLCYSQAGRETGIRYLGVFSGEMTA